MVTRRLTIATSVALVITGAIGGAVLAAGAFTDVASKSDLVKVFGLVALGAWAVAVALFVRAVAAPVERIEEGERIDPAAFVSQALELAHSECGEIDRRLVSAQWAAAAATLATVLALAFVFFGADQKEDVTLVLSRGEATKLIHACPLIASDDTITGRLSRESLGSDFLELEADQDECLPSRARLEIRRSDVLAVRFQ